MYQLVIDRYAQKQLGKISPPHFNRIIKAINELAEKIAQLLLRLVFVPLAKQRWQSPTTSIGKAK